MNAKQREYLVKQIEEQSRLALGELEKRKPVPPSLNNYLIAASLSGKLQIRTSEEIAVKVREMVLKLGSKGAIVESESRYNYRYQQDEEDKFRVSLLAEDVFVFPEEYLVALREYEEAFEQWSAEYHALKEMKKTVEIKVTIGSDKALESLIREADSLASLSIINAKLTADQKLLEGK